MDFCKASDYYKEFSREVVYSNPTQSREDVLEILQRWLKKKRRRRAISSEDLAKNLHCVHVPYLFAQATVSFGWSATVRVKKRGYKWGYDPATRQNKSIPYTYYENDKKSGAVVDRDVCEWSVETMHGEMKCGAPDFGKAEQDLKPENVLRTPGAMHLRHSDLTIISPPTRTEEQVKQRFREVLESGTKRVATADAAHTPSRSVIGQILFDSEEVMSVETTGIEVTGTATEWVHLYPVWLSHYTYKDKVYAVEVDAHTGQIYVDEPVSKLMEYGCGCLLILFLGPLLFGLLVELLDGLLNLLGGLLNFLF